MSVQQAKLRKTAANATPISQECQLLTNCLSSRSQSTGRQGRITRRVSEHEVGTTQVVNDNPSTTSDTLGEENDDEYKSTVEVADNNQQPKTIEIGFPQSPFNDIRPRLIPYLTVSTINYQYGRLLKDHSIMAGCQERETMTFQSFYPSLQLRTIQTLRKQVCVNNIYNTL